MSRPIDDRPGLAVMYRPHVLVLQLLEAAAGQWRYIWLVDQATGGVDEALRMLNRTGSVADVTDLDADEAAAALTAHRPTGIISFDENDFMRATLIGHQLGLPVNSPETVRRLTNKWDQRMALQSAGLPVPSFWPVRRDLDASARDRLCATVHYPAILKPQKAVGSQDAFRIPDAATLRTILDEISDRGVDGSDLIIEELLADGWPRERHPFADFVSVESILSAGRISHLAVTGRATLAEPFRETGNFIPAFIDVGMREAVADTAEQAIRATEAVIGVFHTEVKITPDGPRVIEVNGRVGGAGIPEILMLAGGHSILNVACRVALGESLHFEELLPCSRVGYSVIAPPPLDASVLYRLENLDAVSHLPGVSVVAANRHDGDPVSWREGYDGRLYWVYAVADDHDAMWAVRDRIHETVKVAYA